jgi:hypothetical protein
VLTRANRCLDRRAEIFDDGSWVLHVTPVEAAELHKAKDRIRDTNCQAFGTSKPGRSRMWWFSIKCLRSEKARKQRAQIIEAYEAYLDLLERLRFLALGRVSID